MPTYRFPITGIRYHDFAGRLDELYELAPGRRMSISIEHGNVEQHFDAPTSQPASPSQPMQEEKSCESPVYLTKEPRGCKIDLIRVINVLYMLGFFTGKDGKKVTKKEVFTALGRAVNLDLSTYDSDLSRSLSDSTALISFTLESLTIKADLVVSVFFIGSKL